MDSGITPKHALISLGSVLVVLAAMYALIQYFGLNDVQGAVARAGVWAPLVLIVAKASTIVIAPLSGSPLYPLAGALFGFWKGFFIVLTGDALGSIISFYISRFFGRTIAEKMLGSEQGYISKALAMMGTVKGFFMVRLCFISAPEIAAYGAGLTRLHVVPFIGINTLLGAIPVLLLTKMGTYIAAGSWWSVPLTFGVNFVVALVGVVLFNYFLNKESQEGTEKTSA